MLHTILALTLAHLAHAEAPELKTFPAAGLKKVIVENENGTTKVQATAKSQAAVGVEKKNFSSSCKLTIEREGDTLTARVSRQSIKPSEACEADLNLRVPSHVDVSISSGSGNAEAHGPFKDLSFQVGSGNFTAEGPVDHFLGQSGSGAVRLEKLSGGGELKVGSGDSTLVYTAPMRAGKLSLKAGSGDAKVKLPKGTKVKVTFAAGSGKLKNDFEETSAPKFEISMEAGSGNLSVEKE